MSIVPLDLQRRCEQRWAARFARQAPEPPSQKSEHEKQGHGSPRPLEREGKIREPSPPDLRSAGAV